MARPPAAKMKRYAGRTRSAVSSIKRKLAALKKLNDKYNASPIASYPNQLAPAADQAAMTTMLNTVTTWLTQKGPIPSR